MDDLISRKALLAEYDRVHIGEPGKARKLIEDAPAVQEWISVKDRLPDTIPCGAGTEYSEAVNVLTDGRKVLTAIWNGLHWICDAEFWDAEFEEITHWTPVLLPMPQPPKGE